MHGFLAPCAKCSQLGRGRGVCVSGTAPSFRTTFNINYLVGFLGMGPWMFRGDFCFHTQSPGLTGVTPDVSGGICTGHSPSVALTAACCSSDPRQSPQNLSFWPQV